jgi:hypothetical protein
VAPVTPVDAGRGAPYVRVATPVGNAPWSFTVSAVQVLFAGSAKYLIGAGSALLEHDDATVIRDGDSARHVLRQCVGNQYAMRMLRTLLSEVLPSAPLNLLDDVGAVEVAAGLVGASRLRLVGPVPRLRAAAEYSSGRAVAPAPAPAATPPASRPASRTPVESAEPSFIPNLDVAALASMLRDAARDGTPFCEECARASRAA